MIVTELCVLRQNQGLFDHQSNHSTSLAKLFLSTAAVSNIFSYVVSDPSTYVVVIILSFLMACDQVGFTELKQELLDDPDVVERCPHDRFVRVRKIILNFIQPT